MRTTSIDLSAIFYGTYIMPNLMSNAFRKRLGEIDGWWLHNHSFFVCHEIFIILTFDQTFPVISTIRISTPNKQTMYYMFVTYFTIKQKWFFPIYLDLDSHHHTLCCQTALLAIEGWEVLDCFSNCIYQTFSQLSSTSHKLSMNYLVIKGCLLLLNVYVESI